MRPLKKPDIDAFIILQAQNVVEQAPSPAIYSRGRLFHIFFQRSPYGGWGSGLGEGAGAVGPWPPLPKTIRNSLKRAHSPAGQQNSFTTGKFL